MMEQDRFTLEALSDKVAELLDGYDLLERQQDGRVSAVPDSRTIRYYTSLGLVDRPRIEGRQAWYGKRHMLQLLAIKALQQSAMPLAEIQERLYAKSDRELESILGSISAEGTRHVKRPRPVLWREVTVEPGLKLLAEEGWSPALKDSQLLDRMQTAIASLKSPSGKNGE